MSPRGIGRKMKSGPGEMRHRIGNETQLSLGRRDWNIYVERRKRKFKLGEDHREPQAY